MRQIRIIPCLQLANQRLVKTVKFKIGNYIGDPVNTIKIFNDLEVDELCFLDITASGENKSPDFNLLRQIANECFMPLSYGGGINSFEAAKDIFSIGFEKIVLNTAAVRHPKLIGKIAEHFGSQAVIAAVDVRKNLFGRHEAITNNGRDKVGVPVVEWAQRLEAEGAGEILLTSIDRDGSWKGYDILITEKIARAVSIPVIANGGAGKLRHLTEAVEKGASAVAVSSLVLYQNKDMGVLINYRVREIKLALALNQIYSS